MKSGERFFNTNSAGFPLALMKDPCNDFALLFLSFFFLPSFFFPSYPRLYASFRIPEGHARSLINVLLCWTIFCDPRGSRRWIFRASLARDNERNNRSWNMVHNTCLKYPDILFICVIIIISVWIVSKCINWGWINDKRYLLSLNGVN